ncbi:MAG TPA: SxtJ family membrane protein [Planctomycetota bacterium]|nr:SxtJ family membrane protein [Planctomycetota bacterium]
MLKIDFHPKDDQLRQFAWFSLVGFPLIGWVLHWRFSASPTVAWTLTGIGLAVFIAGMANPRLVKPVFVGLMLIAVPIGFVLSTAVLVLLYYGLFTPVALLFRLTGRDKLQRRLDPSAASYWCTRPASIPAARYLRMY